MLMEVTIFDNLNTFINQVVHIAKNVGHCLSQIPDFLVDSVISLNAFTSYFPPFITFIILFVAFTGIILKGAHWGN